MMFLYFEFSLLEQRFHLSADYRKVHEVSMSGPDLVQS
jgi:hypothetical protein